MGMPATTYNKDFGTCAAVFLEGLKALKRTVATEMCHLRKDKLSIRITMLICCQYILKYQCLFEIHNMMAHGNALLESHDSRQSNRL
jgi:hypothetical protein